MAKTKVQLQAERAKMKLRGEILSLTVKQQELKDQLSSKRESLKEHVQANKKS